MVRLMVFVQAPAGGGDTKVTLFTQPTQGTNHKEFKTMTTISNNPALSDQTITPSEDLPTGITDLRTVLQPGDFLARTLVTDTSVYEVVKVAAKTITLRHARQTDERFEDDRVDQSQFPVIYTAVEGDPDGSTLRVGLSKDGRLKVGNWARAGVYYRPTRINGRAVKRTDFRC